MLGLEDGHDFGAALTNQASANRLVPTEGGRELPTTATARKSSLFSMDAPIGRRSSGRTRGLRRPNTKQVLLSLLSASPAAMAACIPLQGSKECSAFQSASVSTDSFLVGLFPFLQFVSDAKTFDERMQSYLQTDYIREKYQTLMGCGGITFTNTSDLYARFTTTVICNAIIQNSIEKCNLSPANSRPVCSTTCAQFAESEMYIVEDSRLCQSPGGNAGIQARADFTNCALPADALSSNNCISGITNEPENCGYGNSTLGLCTYCKAGGINSTDTCCYSSNAETRCAGVVLPSFTPSMTFPTSPPTGTPSGTGAPVVDDGSRSLSGGKIAGIVVGSLLGVALLLALIFLLLRYRRKRKGSQDGSIFNQPSPSRKGVIPPPLMAQNVAPQGYEVLPGGRIARMSAIEGHSGDAPSRHADRDLGLGPASAVAASSGYAAGSRRRGDDHSSSDGFGDSPESDRGTAAGVLRPPPTTLRRNGSLSSGSVLAGEDPNSPTSAGGMSSPQGMASQQSEQLPFFKDYYSQDDIHPGDRVAVLWAYQPRAADEFNLERGDMLKVVGIWDDGWATGVMVDERAEEWEARRQAQRDSGVSNTSGRLRDASPPVSGEIKAFPLVCVCLPEHWRKTIEGDGSTETGSSAHQLTATTGS